MNATASIQITVGDFGPTGGCNIVEVDSVSTFTMLSP